MLCRPDSNPYQLTRLLLNPSARDTIQKGNDCANKMIRAAIFLIGASSQRERTAALALIRQAESIRDNLLMRCLPTLAHLR